MMFGATVRRLRKQRGLKLRRFAPLVGMSPTYLSQVERGNYKPPAKDKVVAIAKALGRDPDEFLRLAGKCPECGR